MKKVTITEKKRQDVIVADTSGLIALFNHSDQNHAAAAKAAARLRYGHKDILVPTVVCVEFLNILGRKIGHKGALAAIAALKPPFLVVNDHNDFFETPALKTFNAVRESASFTDCLVMAVAAEYGTKDIFSSNKEFEDAGYRRLIPATEVASSQIESSRTAKMADRAKLAKSETTRNKALEQLIMKDVHVEKKEVIGEVQENITKKE